MNALADSEHFMPGFRVVGDHAYEVSQRFNALFSAFAPAAGAIEDDVLDMCVEVFQGGEDGRCNITAGGTENMYSAMVAMREWARDHKPHLTEPELVAPHTVHAAFSRAAHYFGFTIRRAPVGDDWKVAPADTVGIAASAPNWPYGFFDPNRRPRSNRS